MSQAPNIDGLLIQWGDRLFYPGNRIVKVAPQPKSGGSGSRQRAAAIRERIAATVLPRAPQVMVKVTGGGRGMQAITAHFRYISKNGRLDIEDERGQTTQGKEAVHELADDWRFGGSLIDDVGHRREAFNLMLSMPRGTDAQYVLRAAREFAQAELADHKYVMVLHDHQANPHVHLSVRAESQHGVRLNPRKADLQRWRETFAEKLRGWGIAAEATRQTGRGQARSDQPLWRIKAAQDGRLRSHRTPVKASPIVPISPADAAQAWQEIAKALALSPDRSDRELGEAVVRFVREPAPAVQRDGHQSTEIGPAIANEGPARTR